MQISLGNCPGAYWFPFKGWGQKLFIFDNIHLAFAQVLVF
jgi:hypothetical protein